MNVNPTSGVNVSTLYGNSSLAGGAQAAQAAVKSGQATGVQLAQAAQARTQGAQQGAASPDAAQNTVQNAAQAKEAKGTNQASNESVDAANNPAAAQSMEEQRNQMEDAAKKISDFVGVVNSSLQFSTDEESGTLVLKIIDKDTEEVLRQMPSEEALALAKALDNFKGLLVSNKS